MTNFHAKSTKQTEEKLRTNLKLGLSQKEAEKRKKQYGPNKLPEEKPLSWLYFLWSQFKSPLVYVLCMAAGISLILGEYIDFWIIIAAIAINVSIGFFQEYKASRTLQQLKKLVQLKAKVLRSGIEYEIDVEELVPGDIIFLEAGDKISCDARLFETINFSTTEASLTGESLPSTKSTQALDKDTPLADRENMIYMGTQVARGKAKAAVCATGENTELGRIALMVKETPEEDTTLQKKIAYLSKILGIFLAAVTIIIFIIGLLRGHSGFEMLLTSVALAVAAIPEGLPAAVAITLALAMQKILERKGLVKRLIAAETLGSTSIICTDKTGTLTKGEMAVSHIVTWEQKNQTAKNLALKISLLNNDAVIENPEAELEEWKVLGSPTEKALLLAAAQAGFDKSELETQMPRIDEIPFSGERKYMATLHKQNAKNVIYLKGAPEKIINKSSHFYNNGRIKKISQGKNKELESQLLELTNKGLRVLAVAYKDTQDNRLKAEKLEGFTLVGFIALKDPLRKEARETIDLCQKAGIRIIIVTGDHKMTAKAIAQELGLDILERNILEGPDLDKMNDDELRQAITEIDIFARIEPKHKVRIVDAWQAQKEVTAMIGDGVNDAPALKSADIGVALGSGTDVTKETSEIIILDNNLATLVAAVEQGRVAFENIRKVTLYLLADAFSEVLLIGGALLLGFPLPILAAQILWVNIVEDGLPDIALAFEPGEKQVMEDKPRKIKEPIVNLEMKILIFAIGIIDDIILLGLYWWLLKQGELDLNHIRTIIFVALSIDSLLYVFACRSLRFSIFRKNPFSNRFLVIAVLIGAFFMVLGVYLPFLQKILQTVSLTPEQWILPIVLAVFELILIEIVKEIFIIKRRHKLLKAVPSKTL
jgi:Ca2+-transporting ATPase